MTHKMYFNTGVQPHNHPNATLMEFQSWRDGTLQIEFHLETAPPAGWTLSHLCNQPHTGDAAIKVVGGGMFSKYAIFKTK